MGINKKKPLVREKIGPLYRANGNFDRKFWRQAGAAMRFAAAWQMVKDFLRFKGIDGHKLRLQRSVQVIKQA